MKYIVSLSGGIASAVAANRVMKKYPEEQIILWFSDTSFEDQDLYRFLDDLENYWGNKIVRYKDGRTPLDVFEEQNIIGNSRLAPCSDVLKISPFRKFVKSNLPCTVYLGMDWTEFHRTIKPTKNYNSIGAEVDYPLLWNPKQLKRDYMDEVKSWGIDIPELYRLGFTHNNCGGRCIRQGQIYWKKLKEVLPERFDQMNQWEKKQRKKLGDHTIIRDKKTLDSLQVRSSDNQLSLGLDDESCFCIP